MKLAFEDNLVANAVFQLGVVVPATFHILNTMCAIETGKQWQLLEQELWNIL